MSAPVAARSIAAASRMSPAASVIPAALRSPARAWSRTSAATCWPRAASDRARWPPVNPVAPVTRTRTSDGAGPSRDERHRRPERTPEAEAFEGTLDPAGGGGRAEQLVEGNRQDELFVRFRYAEPALGERTDHLALTEDTIRLDSCAQRVRNPAGHRLNRGRTRPRGIVQHDAMAGDRS